MNILITININWKKVDLKTRNIVRKIEAYFKVKKRITFIKKTILYAVNISTSKYTKQKLKELEI